MSKVTADELNALFKEMFPGRIGDIPVHDECRKGFVKLHLDVSEKNLRPGGYISGPTQMTMADHAAYVATFTQTGVMPMAVTSNLNIDFLRPCIGSVLIAEATLIKIGRTLAVSSVDMFTDKNEKLASRASVTYALPQKRD